MPLIDITCAPRVSDDSKRRLVEELPHIVSVAVACAAEPYDGRLQPGDVLIRCRSAEPGHRFDIDVLIEVKSKWFEDRAADRDRRVAHIHDEVARILPAGHLVGVYLSLPVAAWAQTEDD
ncbi:hypothetical protein C5E45_14165 [Nocardia nova]|uniref:Uncharacterized protein n=1 Tax=Nocardia nova TaxID=37330 RepID=A0A2S6ARE1_9NOCA|nr:hypothetical protein [Nocardia nova]PPJ27431.1 hypothetical protein C5E41_16080 [Nocardia nova]PPJ37774.1 hypothetical protein C5E45_14165 [Nocardia nova]